MPKKKKSPDKYDYVCGSDINNGSNSHSTNDSGGDSDGDETKDDYGVEIESGTKGELSSDMIQQIVCYMKISDQPYICNSIGVPEHAIDKGAGDNDDKLIVDDTENFLKEIIVQQWRAVFVSYVYLI